MSIDPDVFLRSRPTDSEARSFMESFDHRALIKVSAALRDKGHGELMSYSPKVFIPLTILCRDVCHYCTFAEPPVPGVKAVRAVETDSHLRLSRYQSVSAIVQESHRFGNHTHALHAPYVKSTDRKFQQFRIFAAFDVASHREYCGHCDPVL